MSYKIITLPMEEVLVVALCTHNTLSKIDKGQRQMQAICERSMVHLYTIHKITLSTRMLAASYIMPSGEEKLIAPHPGHLTKP